MAKKRKIGQINSVFKWFNASPPQFFQLVPYAIADISWKFHEKLFIYLSIILLTDTPPRLDGRPWNSLVMRESVYLFISCVVPDISWKIDEDPFIRFSIIILTITDSRNRKKIDPEFKGLITTTRECSDCSLSHVQSFLKISWKSVHPFSRNVASRHGFPWKKKDIKNCIVELYTSMYLRSSIEGVKHNTPIFFRLFLGSCST